MLDIRASGSKAFNIVSQSIKSRSVDDGRSSVCNMAPEDPEVEELKRRQLAQEQAERRALEDAHTSADAEKHKRRAEKAHYLPEKLQEREEADRLAARDDE